MATAGFEVLYSSISSSLTSLDAAAIAVVHWNLVSNGLKCCGIGESWPSHQSAKFSGSELLPEGWLSDDTIYTLRYIDASSDRKYLMKGLAIDGSLILHLIRCFDEKTVSTSIRSRDFVNDHYSSFQTAYSNLGELNLQLTKELYRALVDEKGPSTSNAAPHQSYSYSAPSNERQPGRSPLMVEDPRRTLPPGGIGYIPPRQPFSSVDPFSVGRADLDPLATGMGGGMFMDPRSFPGQGGVGPGGPLGPGHQGFPPGSVPPGARFDPLGPPGVRNYPDPDHERPPDHYDDMFM